MSAGVVAAGAIAILALLAMALTIYRARSRLALAGSQAAELEAQLAAARQSSSDAERRTDEAERTGRTALDRARYADQQAAAAGDRWISAGALWQLEQLRAEREWAEVTGMPLPLPVPWEDGIRAAVAVELEMIREVMGTPSQLDPVRPSMHLDPVDSVAVSRLAAEVLRRLARTGEELVVSFGVDDVTMAAVDGPAGPEPDLTRLAETAAALGSELTLLTTADGVQVRLRLPVRSLSSARPV
jgi:hypothetical protein